jgi:electron transfer flavoprotein alpha subunit/NAD-dependent dihydropyrimidine dehydrogenase PreA subunit
MAIKVNADICVGCGACVSQCPFGAVEIKDDIAAIGDKCTLCGTCADACPVTAIEITAEPKAAPADDITAYKGVWVFAEQRAGAVAPVSFELLGEGRRLADKLGVQLSAVIFGTGIEPGIKSLIEAGADNVYVYEDALLNEFHEDAYADALTELIREHKPEAVLVGATSIGRAFTPMVAWRIRTGLTADCTGLDIDTGKRQLQQTRPAFGGNIMATILCPDNRPQMSTVRPGVMKRLAADPSRTGEVIRKKPAKPLTSRTRLRNVIEVAGHSINISEAEIIVSGGRGMGSDKGFALLKELADALGGVVGASRAAVDNGWMPYPHQIGQTGRTVCPKIYFACGISGAIQHLAGMQSSDLIIAINKDASAPIFNVADYGIVGDVFEVLPQIIKQVKEARG